MSILLLLLQFDVFSQTYVDSLKSALQTAVHDTVKIKIRANLGEQLPVLRVGYWDSLRIDAGRWKMKKIVAQSVNNMGYVWDNLGDVAKALEYYTEGLKLREELGDKYGIAESLNNLALMLERQGDIPRSLEYQFRSLKIQEEIKDSAGISRSLLNIAHIYENQDDIAKALEYYKKSLDIALKIGDLTLVATDYNNIGLVYRIMTKNNSAQADSLFTLATGYLSKALEIFKKTGDMEGVATIYQNTGMIYSDRKNAASAVEFFRKSLEVWESIDNKKGMTYVLINIGQSYLDRNNPEDARKYGERALKISRELGFPMDISLSSDLLTQVYSMQGRWKDAFTMQQLYQEMKDSINNETTKKASLRKQFQYEYDKKEALLKSEQEKERAVSVEKARKQKIIIYSIISGFVMMMIFAAFIYRSLRITKKQKKIIEIKSHETEQQKKIIEEKNKDITDSITYAKRIQTAMLPVKEGLKLLLPESFILFKPKDIVSGDFYFFRKAGNTIYLAAADCTGHGVPGAFMSLIGTEKLEEAISAGNDASAILRHLNNGIRSSLHQSDSPDSTHDGMDIGLCIIDADQRIIKFAGANRPLWIIRRGASEVEEIPGTKSAIGGYTDADQLFESAEIRAVEGDTFYMFSDGYADTYGGKDGKKLKSKNFREILVSIRDMEMREQCDHLDRFIEDWKGGTEQVDDILIIGVRM